MAIAAAEVSSGNFPHLYFRGGDNKGGYRIVSKTMLQNSFSNGLLDVGTLVEDPGVPEFDASGALHLDFGPVVRNGGVWYNILHPRLLVGGTLDIGGNTNVAGRKIVICLGLYFISKALTPAISQDMPLTVFSSSVLNFSQPTLYYGKLGPTGSRRVYSLNITTVATIAQPVDVAEFSVDIVLNFDSVEPLPPTVGDVSKYLVSLGISLAADFSEVRASPSALESVSSDYEVLSIC